MRDSKIKSVKRFIVGALIIAGVTTLMIVPALTYLNQLFLESDLERIETNLISGIRQRANTLKNATWAFQRYVYLKNRSSKADQEMISSVKSAFLPGFSYGIDSDYFILLDMAGKTVMEVRQGALTNRKSSIVFKGWDEASSGEGKLYYRPCRVNLRSYLCLLNNLLFREYLKDSEKYLALITIDEAELYLLGRVFEQRSIPVLPTPNVTFNFVFDEGSRHFVPKSGTFNFLSTSRLIDDGFWITLQTNFWDFLQTCFTIIFVISGLVTTVGWMLQSRFKSRLNSQMDLVLLKNERKNLERVRSLVKGVLHDIQSPFTALKILASQETNPEKRGMMDLLIKRMQTVISDLQGKSASGGQDSPSMLPVDLLVQLVAKEKSREWSNKVNVVTKEIARNLWVQGQFSEFLRMMSNIVNNAAEASRNTQTITLSVTLRNQETVEIVVRDEGCGIDPEIIKKLLSDGGSFNKEGGSGFGLSHARKTCKAMDGKLEIESTPDAGTTVRVLLPMKPAPTWGHSPLEIHEYKTIVIIDDEEIFCDIWRKKLFQSGKEFVIFKHPSHVPKELLAKEDAFFIVDNNYGSELNLGVEFIKRAGSARSVLSTSDWWVSQIQEEVRRINTGLVGKDVLEWISVRAN